MLLKAHGYDRNSLLKLLFDNKIVTKKQKIVDKNKDGTSMVPVMRVKYSVPKHNFENKLKRLYIREFEKNTINEECAAGGDCGGSFGGGDSGNSQSGSTTTFTTGDYQFIQPCGGIVSQVGYNGHKKKKEIDEVVDSTIGDFGYDAPAFIDKETADREGGENHSLCVNFED
jgi:hypothetical protein